MDSSADYAVHPQAPGPGPEPARRGPHLAWILLCAALMLVLGVIVTVAPALSISNAAPSTTFAGVEPTLVTIDPADGPMIYASTNRQGRANCGVAGGPAPDQLALSQAGDESSIELDGVTWEPLFHIEVPAPGDYQVVCTSDTDVTFGVGSTIGFGNSTVFSTLVYGCTGALAATMVSLIKRRRSARRSNG